MTSFFYTCIILLLPILIWNLAIRKKIPEKYFSTEIWGNIPIWLKISEPTIRILVYLAPVTLGLSWHAPIQQIGLVLYILGLSSYFLSWIWQINFPESKWSTSLIGHLTPSFTQLLFFSGIGLIGFEALIPLSRFPNYLIVSALYVSLHSYHSYLSYRNINGASFNK